MHLQHTHTHLSPDMWACGLRVIFKFTIILEVIQIKITDLRDLFLYISIAAFQEKRVLFLR